MNYPYTCTHKSYTCVLRLKSIAALRGRHIKNESQEIKIQTAIKNEDQNPERLPLTSRLSSEMMPLFATFSPFSHELSSEKTEEEKRR